LLIGVNLLQYLRTRGKDAVDRALITSSVSVACVSLAVWMHTQFSWSAWGGLTCDDTPWIVIVEPELTALVLAVGAFASAWRLWKRNMASLWAAFAVSVFCAAMVYFPPTNSRILHIWVVTAAALAALVFSLFKKQGRWFVYGFGWIALLFFRETSAFWLSLKWWIYLLAVGLTLVAIAAVNEAGRRKGAGLVDKLKQSRIREWRW
jgi:cell division protein FtsW (lipid II flippase)